MGDIGQPIQEPGQYVWLTVWLAFARPIVWLTSNNVATAEKQGVKVKLNASSTWNGGPMLRTELLPQTTNSLSGHLYVPCLPCTNLQRFLMQMLFDDRYFHVSLQIPTVNPPGGFHRRSSCYILLLIVLSTDPAYEHQVKSSRSIGSA